MSNKTNLLATKEQFKEFVKIQKSGMYNMLDPIVKIILCVDDQTYQDLCFNYNAYSKEYPDVLANYTA